MRALVLIGSVDIAKAAVGSGRTGGVIFNKTEAEWAENRAVFDRNMEEFETSNYVSTVDVTRSMAKCTQECSQWCWAASATMVSSVFTSISTSQCMEYEERAVSSRENRQCDSSCSYMCDEAGYPINMIRTIQDFSGVSYTYTENSLSQQALDSALQLGPVIVLVSWDDDDGGHAITCYGVSGGQYQVHDPEGQDISLSYSQLMRYKVTNPSKVGNWAETVQKSGSTESSTESVQV